MAHLALVSLVVADYDEAIDYYTNKMGFELVEDTRLSSEKRWVIVRPAGSQESGLLLAKAANEQQQSRIGNQTGGRVFLFLNTDTFERDYQRMQSEGITFVTLPRDEPYGRVVVLEDLYGNRWDLIQPTAR